MVMGSNLTAILIGVQKRAAPATWIRSAIAQAVANVCYEYEIDSLPEISIGYRISSGKKWSAVRTLRKLDCPERSARSFDKIRAGSSEYLSLRMTFSSCCDSLGTFGLACDKI